MSRKGRISLNKKVNPLYIVFCEGETEECYVKFLKQKYRIPIRIISKVTGQEITDKYIEAYRKEVNSGLSSNQDKNYLMYDIDTPEFNTRLYKITNGIHLISNPNIELWFLLHYKEQNAYIDSANCVEAIKKLNPNYKKGRLNNELEKVLNLEILTAVKRAKSLNLPKNPSTSVYLFIDELERVKQ
ncbi:MAG: RloB family protein [bacterium]